MKKIIVLTLALTLLLALTACGEPVVKEGGSTPTPTQQLLNDPTPSESAGTQQSSETMAFVHNGVTIPMNAPAADIVTALGEAKSYTEETSCAFVGLDKTYYYGSFYLQTYPEGDKDFVYCLWIVDDSVSTPEGLYIGAPQSLVESALGAAAFNGTNAYTVTKGEGRLTVILENGAVSSIQYDAVLQ